MPRFLALILIAVALCAGDASTRILAKGELSITVALPDRENGHYRGIRFDHGGIVTEATWRGHSFFGILKPPRDPKKHDGASGTPEEFNIDKPAGFAEAADGGTFLKIGVGALVRPNRTSYGFMRDYAVAQWATWTVKEEADAITCSHSESAGAYAVTGSRTIRLLPGGDGFVIERELTSTGTAELPVEHYNHTMIIIDGKPISPDYSLTYAVPVTVTHKLLAADGATVRFPIGPKPGESAWTEVKGLPDTPAAGTVRIANAASKVAVELSTDTTPTKVVIYAEATAICPEAFTAFTLKPGESKRWSQTYRFSASN